MTLILFITTLTGCAESDGVDEYFIASPVGLALGTDVTSLEERIALSDVVVLAKFVSATSGAVEYPYGHIGHAIYRFKVLEYLLGKGPDEVDVVVEICCELWSFERSHALEGGPWLIDRHSQWHDRDAILFLNEIRHIVDETSSLAYTFAAPRVSSVTSFLYFAIDSEHNKAWLPAKSYPSDVSSTPRGDNQLFLTDWSEGEPSGAAIAASPPTITLDNIRQRIVAVESTISTYDTAELGRRCVRRSYGAERLRKVYSESAGNTYEFSMPSGSATGTEFHVKKSAGSIISNDYPSFHIVGETAGLFEFEITDDDETAGNGYSVSWFNKRPIPAGVYSYLYTSVRSLAALKDDPCTDVSEFKNEGELIASLPQPRKEWIITVTAPNGPLYEAFFDPVTLTAPSDSVGMRYNPNTSFTLPDKTSITLDYLYYASGIVKMGTTPHNALHGYEIDIIEMDGKVSSIFAFGGSGSTSAPHEWATCVQPWDAGDTLMLRIRAARAGSREGIPIQPCSTCRSVPTLTMPATPTAPRNS